MSVIHLVLMLALMALWGGNFVVIQLGTEVLNPLVLTLLRFTFAVFPMILFVPRPQVPWRYLLGYGACFGLGVWGMMVSAIHLGLSAGMAGLLLDLSLVSSLILGVLWFKESIGPWAWFGATLAVAGLLVSLTLTDGSVPLATLPLCIIAALSWSLMSALVKHSQVKQIFAFSVWGMAFAPPVLLVAVIATQGLDPILSLPTQLNAQAWFSILFQAWPVTLLGYWFYNRMTLTYGISKIAPFTLLNPIFGLWASAWVYGELVSTHKLLAFALILGGFALGQWGDKLWPYDAKGNRP